MSKKRIADISKKEFSVLYAKGELTKTGQNYLTALPVIERIFDCFSREATHVGYDGPSYSPAGYVTHSRVKKKILKFAENEDFLYFGACALENNYKIASQDYKVLISLDVKRNFIVFATPEDIVDIKSIIIDIDRLINSSELVYFKTISSSAIFDLAYNQPRENIDGFKEIPLE